MAGAQQHCLRGASKHQDQKVLTDKHIHMSTEEIIKQFEPAQHNLLNILHAVQNSHPQNYLTEQALEETARYLKLTKSSVYGVARYYTMFSLKPRGRHLIRLCVSPVCELLKANDILAILQKHLGIGVGETTSDGLFTLEFSECLGQCQEAPSMMINDQVYNGLDEEEVGRVLTGIRRRRKKK